MMHYTQQEKKSIVIEGLKNIFWDFCNNGKIYISLGHFYPELRNWIRNNITKDEAKQIKIKAIEDYKKLNRNIFETAVQSIESDSFELFYKDRLVKKCFAICKSKNIPIEKCLN